MKERIVWVDIYKAIAIVLVVVGHATGLFNSYIYMFHVSSFFFISGYVFKCDKDNLGTIILKRLYALILPLFVCIVIHAFIMEILTRIGQYENWFGEYGYIGFGEIFKLFLQKGSIWAWLLGPAWFLVVLFFVSILSKILWSLSSGNSVIMALYSVLLYIWGYVCIKNKYLIDYPYAIRNVMIAQFFFCAGFIIKKHIGIKLNSISVRLHLLCTLFSGVAIIIISRFPNMTVDYASEKFGNIFFNMMTSFIGVIFIYSLSNLILNANKYIVDSICFVGENTLGILLFHFTFFKMTFLLLSACSLIPKTEKKCITPATEIGNKYWPIFLAISIVGSIIVWQIIKKIPVLNVIFGFKPERFKTMCEENKKRLLAISGVSIFYFASAIVLVNYIYNMSKPINIQFPNEIKEQYVCFKEGWQPQNDEPYRWIEDTGTLEVNSFCHSKLYVQGFVPEDFDEVNRCDVYINSKKIGSLDVSEKGSFEGMYNIKEVVKGYNFTITLDFDGVHKPDVSSGDLRTLSALISEICIN